MKSNIAIFCLLGFIFCFVYFACTSDKVSNGEMKELISEAPTPATVANSTPNPQSEIANSRHNAITHAVELISPAVVGINVTQIREVIRRNPFFDDPMLDYFFGGYRYRQKVQSLGSGVIISSDGYILSNEHVVHNAAEIVVTLTGGKKYPAKIIGSDVTTDIALLKIEDTGLTYGHLGNSEDIIIGEWAIAFGNPFGLFDVGAEPSVSVGVISATNRDFGRQDERVYQDMIQTDAAINSGNSGGPLVNGNGEIIGINTFIFSGSENVGTSIGLGFAIPINRIKKILPELKTTGQVNRNIRTGLTVNSISRLHARFLGLNSTEGVIVADVEDNSPAARASLQVGDIILKVNNQTVNSGEEIMGIIENSDVKGGDVLALLVQRANHQFETRLKLERIP